MKYSLLLLCLYVVACTSPGPTVTEDSPTDEELQLSERGGFANVATVWKISPDGTIYKKSGTGDLTGVAFERIGTLSEDQTRELFERARQLDLPEGYNEPGNMTYRIVHRRGDTLREVTYGGGNDPEPESFKQFYKNTTRLIRETTATR